MQRGLEDVRPDVMGLAQGEALYREAVDAAGIGVFARDYRTGKAVWSAQVWRLHGLEPGGEPPDEDEMVRRFIHPDDVAARNRFIAEAKAHPEQMRHEMECRLVGADGVTRDVMSVVTLRRDAEGRAIAAYGTYIDISRRRQAERAAAESAAMFRRAAEVAGLCAFDHEYAAGPARWTEQVWEIFGLPPRDGGPADADLLALVHPEDVAPRAARVAALWGDAGCTRGELGWRIVRPDGAVRHVQVTVMYLRGADGVPLRTYGVVQDVTERREAEIGRETVEARFRIAAGIARMGVFERDEVTGAVMWSPRMFEIYGLPPEAGPPDQAGFDALVHPQDRGARREAVTAFLAAPGTEGAPLSFRIVRPDGAVRHIESRAVFHRDATGRAVRTHGVVLDVTEREEMVAALRASEERFRLAINAAHLGVYERDHRSGRAVWSPRMWEIFDLTPADEPPATPAVEAVVHPQDRARRRAYIDGLLREDAGMAQGVTFRLVHRDGSVHEVELRGMLAVDAAGRPVVTRGVVMDVTDRKLAEDALRASEARFRVAAGVARLGVFERWKDGRGVWSPRMWEIYGLAERADPPEEEELLARIHPDDRQTRLAEWRLAWQPWAPERYNSAFRIVWPDGTLRHVEAQTLRIGDAMGEMVMVNGVVFDVTDRVQAQEALQASETRFRLAAEAAGFGVFDREEDGDSVWSRRTWEIYGMEPSAVIPDLAALEAVTPPGDRERRRRFFSDVWAGADGAVHVGAFRVIWPDGSMRHIEMQVLLVRRAGARARIHGVVIDVTDRVRVQEALVAEKERFRHAVEAGRMGVFERDLVTGAGAWSEREWRIFGLEPREGAPDDAAFLAMVHPDDLSLVMAAREQLEGAPSGMPVRSEFRIVRMDGAVRQLVSDLVVIRDGEGRALKIHGVERDVTEEREMRAQAMISANLATLGQMATGIAHELGQPLQAIGTAAGTVNAWVEGGARAAQAAIAMRELERIEVQAERAGKTMRHLLLLGRGGRSDGDSELDEVIEGALDLVGTSIRGSGVEIEIDVPAGLPRIRGGQIELEKVLINLLLNARDAMEGREEKRITLHAWCDIVPEGHIVMLEVGDSGPGVAPAVRSRLFEPFFTTKDVGKGTGLGLAICRTTMTACGGGIALAARGPGAHFVLRFAVVE